MRVVVVVLIRRLTDLKMREAALLTSNICICLNVLKMRVAVGAALLKMREVVLLKVRLEALGGGGGSRSNTPMCRFQDERSSPLICLKMRDESGSPSNSRRGSMRGSAQFDM